MKQEIIIEKYLIAVETWKSSRFEQLTERDFAVSVQNVGLTEAEIKTIKQASQAWTQQGTVYHQASNWEQGIFWLEKSLQLEPFNLNLYLLLADCYKHRYIERNEAADCQRAIALAKIGLGLAPSQLFFAQVETELDNLQAERKRSKLLGWAALVSFGISACLGIWTAINLSAWVSFAEREPITVFLSRLINLFPMLGGLAGLLLGTLASIIWLMRLSVRKYHEQKLQKLYFNPSIAGEKSVADRVWEVVANFGKFLKG